MFQQYGEKEGHHENIHIWSKQALKGLVKFSSKQKKKQLLDKEWHHILFFEIV